MNQELYKLIEDGFKRTQKQAYWVALLIIGVGLFILATPKLDPTMNLSNPLVFILYLIFGGGITGFGIWMLSKIVKRGDKEQIAVFTALNQKSGVASVQHLCVVSRQANVVPQENPLGSQHYIVFFMQSGQRIQISFSFALAKQVYEILRTELPQAQYGPIKYQGVHFRTHTPQ